MVELVARLQAETLLRAPFHEMLERWETMQAFVQGLQLVLGVGKEYALLERAQGDAGPCLQRQEAAHPTPDGHQPPDLLPDTEGQEGEGNGRGACQTVTSHTIFW